MRFLRWEWRDQWAGLLAAVAALPVVAAVTAPGHEPGTGAGRLREGMLPDEVAERFGGRGELVSFKFAGMGLGPVGSHAVPWNRFEDRYRYRGPWTAVDGTFCYDTRETPRSAGLRDICVQPAALALPWWGYAVAAVVGLCGAEVARRRRAVAPVAVVLET